MIDAYEYYGSDFQYYDGGPMDMERYKSLLDQWTRVDGMIRETWARVYQPKITDCGWDGLSKEEQQALKNSLDALLAKYRNDRLQIGQILMGKPSFENERGQPLRMIPLLAPDPSLLVQPIYH